MRDTDGLWRDGDRLPRAPAEKNGKRVVAPAGTLIYIPANAPHTLVSTKEKDVIFIAIKDLSQGIIGMAVDGTMTGPHFEKGYGPAVKARKKTRARPAARR